ncbi:MAG: hypothetical protein WCG04_00995 [Alphaproteobacteria bacterium]
MRVFLKPILFLLLIALSNYSLGNVAPFGLELNKATMKDLESKYDILKKSKKKDNVTFAAISPRLLALKDLKEASFVFDGRDVLQAVILKMGKYKFNEMYDILSEKYQLTRKDIPFIGDKVAYFSQDDSKIILEAPHMSFDLEVTYVTNAFLKESNDKQKDQKKSDLDAKKAAF